MKYGLVGEHLSHSYSKIIHERLAEIDYDLIEVSRDKIDDFFDNGDFTALNVTIPYKEAVIPHLSYIDPLVAEIGAVNTIVRRDGGLFGYNTDAYGMMELIRHSGIETKGKTVAILGTGGTSKTARTVAATLGAKEIISVSRKATGDAIDYATLYEIADKIDIIINTTPVGMYPKNSDTPLDLSRFSALSGVIDAIYNPLMTRLVTEARAAGIAAEGGLYMLVAQAVRASEIFLDKTYPLGTTDAIYSELLSEKENIVLIGMPGSGKSTVGKIVAEALSRELFDTDDIVVKNSGRKIPDIIDNDGEEYFRELERRAVCEAAENGGRVIATGGGAPLFCENVAALRSTGRIYFIDRPLDEITPTEDRPLSRNRAALKARYDERYPIYKRVADVYIDGSGSADTVAERILKEFKK